MYRKMITTALEVIPNTHDIDPRHVEAWLRQEHATLDHLSSKEFFMQAITAIQLIREGGKEVAEQLAQSLGL